MAISRLGIIAKAEGLPIISRAVIRDDTVYVCGDEINSRAIASQWMLQARDRGGAPFCRDVFRLGLPSFRNSP